MIEMVGTMDRQPMKDARVADCIACGQPTMSDKLPLCKDHWSALPRQLRMKWYQGDGRVKSGMADELRTAALKEPDTPKKGTATPEVPPDEPETEPAKS